MFASRDRLSLWFGQRPQPARPSSVRWEGLTTVAFSMFLLGSCLPLLLDRTRSPGLLHRGLNSSFSNVDAGYRMKQSKNVEQPQNHGNHHHPIQDRLDETLP